MIILISFYLTLDWSILKMILEGIPKMLQNKALIVSRDSNDIDYFADALTGVVSAAELPLPWLPRLPHYHDYQGYPFTMVTKVTPLPRFLPLPWLPSYQGVKARLRVLKYRSALPVQSGAHQLHATLPRMHQGRLGNKRLVLYLYLSKRK